MTDTPASNGEFAGKRVTIMGLGLFGGGAAAAEYFARRGALVTVTDLKNERVLARSVEPLKKYPNVEFVFGVHRETDFTRADIVVVNPAVPKTSSYLAMAREAGAALETECNFFVARCPAPIAGVTGSNGKTTTTALLAAMLEQGGRKVWLGGNIGRPLINHLDEIASDDIVVMELSSFQLDDMHRIRRSPSVSVVTNLTPNHLDRHGTMAEYAEAKKAIIRYQGASDTAVLNADDPAVAAWAGECAGRTCLFSLRGEVEHGAFLAGDDLILRMDGEGRRICGCSDIHVPGAINVANVLAAATAAAPCGASVEEIACGVGGFRGVEHRLEKFFEADGVAYYNDSIATTAESAIAGLGAVAQPIVLLAGGYDKKIPLSEFAATIAARCETVVLVGQTAEALRAEIEKCRTSSAPSVVVAGTDFDAAVRAAVEAGRSGGSVLLSPGTASYDMFDNFEVRGRAFKEMVRKYAG